MNSLSIDLKRELFLTMVAIIFIYKIFFQPDGFLMSEYWQSHVLYLTVLLGCFFIWIMFSFSVDTTSTHCIKKYFISLLIQLLGTCFFALTISWIVVQNAVPILVTKITGENYQSSGFIKKNYDSKSRNCHYKLEVKMTGFDNKICVGKDTFDELSDIEFKAKIIGKQSRLGFLVESIEVVEQP